MDIRRLWIIGILAATLLLPACASQAAPQGATSPSQQKTEESTLAPIKRTPTPLRTRGTEAQQAVRDLAARLAVSIDDIEIVSVTTEEMPIGDLGCPSTADKGTPQPPGLVFGKEVVLRHKGQRFVYRVHGMRVVLCEGTIPKTISGPTTLPDGSEDALAAALDDLTGRLSVDRSAVEIVSVEKRMWGDTSLGCPQPGMMYAQVITPGFLIQLKAGSKVYTYHASLIRAVLCEK